MYRPALPLIAALMLAGAALPAAAQTECWIKRDDAGARRSPKQATLLKAALVAEDAIRNNAAFAKTPVPVRMLTEVDAGDWGGRIWVTAFPERTAYSKVWVAGKCELGPAANTLSAGIGRIGVFFNNSVQEPFLKGAEVPKLEGTVGGYPVYNGHVILTRDRKLPWIAQTLADRLEREQTAREKKLDDFRKRVAGMKMPDAAQLKSSYELLHANDPAAAERFKASMGRSGAELAREQQQVYPATLRQMEAAVAAVKTYRASFSAAQLAAPARWMDSGGEERRKLDARVRELRPLSAAEQATEDAARRENRALSGRMQDAIRAGKTEEAARLRGELVAQTAVLSGVQKRHDEQVALKAMEWTDAYQLANLKPGDAAGAMAFKPDPAFADTKEHSRIRLVTVQFAPQGQDYGRGAWMKEAAASFDFAALAALLQ
jgi:hypothetical protein